MQASKSDESRIPCSGANSPSLPPPLPLLQPNHLPKLRHRQAPQPIHPRIPLRTCQSPQPPPGIHSPLRNLFPPPHHQIALQHPPWHPASTHPQPPPAADSRSLPGTSSAAIYLLRTPSIYPRGHFNWRFLCLQPSCYLLIYNPIFNHLKWCVYSHLALNSLFAHCW